MLPNLSVDSDTLRQGDRSCTQATGVSAERDQALQRHISAPAKCLPHSTCPHSVFAVLSRCIGSTSVFSGLAPILRNALGGR